MVAVCAYSFLTQSLGWLATGAVSARLSSMLSLALHLNLPQGQPAVGKLEICPRLVCLPVGTEETEHIAVYERQMEYEDNCILKQLLYWINLIFAHTFTMSI